MTDDSWGFVESKHQTAAVTFKVKDFFDNQSEYRRQQWLLELDEADRRKGCFFANMGDISRERNLKK